MSGKRLSLALIAVFLMSFSIKPSGKLVKAFSALQIYNYFAAKDLFEKSMKKDSVAASYGLSLIYGRDDNPFHNLDSAFKFIGISEQLFPKLDEKKRDDYASLSVDSASIVVQREAIDSVMFQEVLSQPSILAWEAYHSAHKTPYYRELALVYRDSLAFKAALDTNTSASFKQFLDQYPDANQYPEAIELYEWLLFEEVVGPGEVENYQTFINQYPDNPHIDRAQEELYDKYTADGRIESYLEFVRENASSPYVGRAWKQVFALEIDQLTASTLAAFSLRYPDYPFMDELKAEFEATVTRYYPIEVSGSWGFMTEAGEIAIPPVYDWVEQYAENLALVGVGDEVKYINKNGAVIADLGLTDGSRFQKGHAIVEKGEFWGIIDRFGQWTVEPQYEELGEYGSGKYYAHNGTAYGYIDASGNIAIPFVYDNAADFNGGFAVVERNGFFGVIDSLGNPASEFKYDWVEQPNFESLPSRTRRGQKFGLIDENGTLADSLFDRLGDFNEGLAFAAFGKKYGFINTKADTVIPFKYEYSDIAFKESKFVNGHAKVFQKEGVGIIDTTGEKVFPAIFQDVGVFDSTLTAVKKRGKWGYANSEVKLLIDYQYEKVGDFRDTTAIVVLNGNYGVIGLTGEYILQPEYQLVERLGSSFLVKDSLVMLLNTRGDTLVSPAYVESEVLDHRIIKLQSEDGRWDYYDYQASRFIWRSKND